MAALRCPHPFSAGLLQPPGFDTSFPPPVRAAIAQLVRALDCGSRGPPFEPGWRYHSIGSLLGKFQSLTAARLRLRPLRSAELRTAIPERYLNRIAAGQSVALYTDASGTSTAGEVSRVSPAVDVASRTFMVEVTFANADGKLKPGSFGRGTITVGMRTDAPRKYVGLAGFGVEIAKVEPIDG